MVIRKNLNSSALISVYDKSNLKKLCLSLKKHKINIISTGATAKKIRALGFKCKEVANIIKKKEILGGRVKTLDTKIHASILFKRNNNHHIKTFKNLKFPQIDYVIVNFYPFKKTPNKESHNKIEMIDIGGPSMVRSASKNFEYVTTICETKNYDSLIKELDKNGGKTTLSFRKQMARRNFKLTSDYDLSIFKWLNNKQNLTTKNKVNIKYGENPNQRAFFLKNSNINIFNSQISGKELGYNNILDISDGMGCLREFNEPTCLIVKHNNPCGVASSKNIKNAYKKALQSDPVSAFGGVVLLNKKIDIGLARIINHNFYEVIVAPGFNKGALKILMTKKKLILINSSGLKQKKGFLLKSVNSGILYQEENFYNLTKSKIKLVSKKNSSQKTLDDLIFAFKVAKHVKSNAIVLAKNKQTIGVGAGQMSRLDSTRIAILKYKDFFKGVKFVCASDGFFPFTDSLKLLLKLNCDALIQPSGSINDSKIINFAKKNNASLYFVKNRIFKH
tara:strand:- start:1433 stop:2947 length:1515 start_codon:yes stop_codon:yes gene_type:complete